MVPKIHLYYKMLVKFLPLHNNFSGKKTGTFKVIGII